MSGELGEGGGGEEFAIDGLVVGEEELEREEGFFVTGDRLADERVAGFGLADQIGGAGLGLLLARNPPAPNRSSEAQADRED